MKLSAYAHYHSYPTLIQFSLLISDACCYHCSFSTSNKYCMDVPSVLYGYTVPVERMRGAVGDPCGSNELGSLLGNVPVHPELGFAAVVFSQHRTLTLLVSVGRCLALVRHCITLTQAGGCGTPHLPLLSQASWGSCLVILPRRHSLPTLIKRNLPSAYRGFRLFTRMTPRDTA